MVNVLNGIGFINYIFGIVSCLPGSVVALITHVFVLALVAGIFKITWSMRS